MPRNPHRSTLHSPRFLKSSRVSFERIVILPGITFYPEDYRTVGEESMTAALEAVDSDSPPPVELYEGFVLNPRLHKNENGRIYAAYYQSKLSLIPFVLVEPVDSDYIKAGLSRLQSSPPRGNFNDLEHAISFLQRQRGERAQRPYPPNDQVRLTGERPGDWFASPPLTDFDEEPER